MLSKKIHNRFVASFVLVFVLATQLIPAASPGVNRAAAASYCDAAGFVMDVTVPDGTTLAPNTPFTKTWRLKNNGTCTWSTAYTLVFSSGTQMGAPSPVNFPNSVAPGASMDISVQMVAPAAAGHYRGNWMFKNAAGVLFGIGSTASSVFWVDINVSSPMIEAYDFTANYCAATWHYDGGPIPCPFKQNVQQFGYVLRMENAILENGSAAGVPGLLTVPQNKYNGVIMGIFPEMDIFRGDRFQALIGCEYGATGCYVTFELDYLTPQLDLVTIWKFREKYDGQFYRANVDLSPIAFKKGIKLVLIVSAYGPASGDRPLWIAPRIVRPYNSTGVATPTPSLAPSPTLTPTPTATLPPASSCDKAEFVLDVTVPDNTTFVPNQTFIKTWRMKNAGTCTWNASYSLAFVSGDQMGGAPSTPLSGTILPGGTIDISAYLTAPPANGAYQGFWMLRNSSGGFFGIGPSGTSPFWVKINVAGSTAGGYDFAANACSAAWTSGAGALACPGTDGSPSGFALQLNNPQVENGATDARPSILSGPQAIDYGWIQGAFPAYVVQSGDRFQTTIACQYNATACDVFYRLDYQIGTGPINTFWAARERNDGASVNVDLDLASLIGQNVRFILTILANGSSSGDRALWIAPRIYHPATGGVPVPTATPSPTLAPTQTPLPTQTPIPTSTPDPGAGWNLYTNSKYGFSFKTPPGSTNGTITDNSARIYLPYTAGTLLAEKFVEATVVENAATCKSSGYVTTSETVTINGTSFLKETGQEGAAGNIYDLAAYSAFHPGTATCVTVTFVLHSTNPGVYPTPPPPFDVTTESAVFTQIMFTFAWFDVVVVDLPNFAQTVVDRLNARSFSALQASMDTSFVFAFWQSQGTSYPPDQAIQQLQTNYIGPSTQLAPNPSKDLVTLLGGLNPYAILGLDPAKSLALFVSGWGLNGTDQAILYVTQRADGSLYWHSVLIAPGGFPATVEPVTHDAFCADMRIATLLDQLKSSANQSNGDTFSALVSPLHGVDVRLWAYQPAVNFSSISAKTVFTSTDSYNWGNGPSLIADVGSFKDIIQPKLLDVLNAPNMETYCDTLTKVFPLATPWPYPNMRYYNLYKPSSSAGFDFRTWLIGFEYINGQPYLSAMVTIIWEP